MMRRLYVWARRIGLAGIFATTLWSQEAPANPGGSTVRKPGQAGHTHGSNPGSQGSGGTGGLGQGSGSAGNPSRSGESEKTKDTPPRVPGGIRPAAAPGHAAPVPRPGTSGHPGGSSANATRAAAYSAAKKAVTFEHASSWSWWWSYNGARYLNLKAILRRSDAPSLNPDLFDSEDSLNGGAVAEKAREYRRMMVPALRRALSDPDAAVRAQAAMSLGRCGDGTELAPLMNALADKDLDVACAAALGLGLLGEPQALNILRRVAEDSASGRHITETTRPIDQTLRCVALYAIGLLGQHITRHDEGLEQSLAALALDDQHSREINFAALTALGLIGANSCVPALSRLILDPAASDLLRSQAAFALGRIGDRSGMNALVEALRVKSVHVRRSAALALGRLAEPGDHKAVQALMRATQSGADRAQTNFALMALGEVGGASARTYLSGYLRSSYENDRVWAALALGIDAWERETPLRDADRASIIDLFRHGTRPASRGGAIIALALFRDHSMVQEAISLVGNLQTDPVLRAYCAQALGLLRSTGARDILVATARSEEEEVDVRASATLALGLFGDRESLNSLRTIHSSGRGSHLLAGSVIQALGLIGDPETIRHLGHMLVDVGRVDEFNRANAARALGLMGDKDDLPALTRFANGVNYVSQTGALTETLARLF